MVTGDDVRVIESATPDDVRGRRVVGVLPLHLAAEAAEVVNIAINTPIELRGVELSLAQVRQYATPHAVYRVERIG